MRESGEGPLGTGSGGVGVGVWVLLFLVSTDTVLSLWPKPTYATLPGGTYPVTSDWLFVFMWAGACWFVETKPDSSGKLSLSVTWVVSSSQSLFLQHGALPSMF